ncbi:hypothetical protein SSX86_020414 [Deinandra increscens subsp. villosa]|uniref:non-specific serine/threonine protein kinase n=1 Tax=Deinandra increscens subsp. villosa TaxID=3103831 RepID=A0AAP0CMX2_9ASTR
MSHTNQFQHLKIQLEAIQSATDNFSADKRIGRGGFGKVYKGELAHFAGEAMVAFKRLDRAFGQGNPEFWKEIMMLSYCKHENIVSLLGYCDDHDEKILVYKYASKRSLDSYITNDDLTWVQRLKICVGMASGLAYIHTPAQTKLRIVHRDIKSSNILLDDNWNAKISDFGLSKYAPANNQFTFMISNPAGTLGYIDPVYQETGLLTKESDVYSFGVVLFEVLCGRLCFVNKNVQPLIGLVREYYLQNKISELVYSNMKGEIDASSLKLFVDIAYQCLNREREGRPLMTRIMSTLENALDIQVKANAKEKADADERAKAKENAEARAKAKAKTEANTKRGILNVKLVRTSKFGASTDASNHYLALCIDPSGPLQNMKKTAKYNSLNSEWIEEFNLYVEMFLDQRLIIHVNNVVSVQKHIHMGQAMMPLTDLTPEILHTCNLDVQDDQDRYVGNIEVEVLFKPTNIEDVISCIQKLPTETPKGGGLLVIIIHRASLYHEKHIHSSVSLLFRGELRKTPFMMNTSRPMWQQEFIFMLEKPLRTNEKLHFDVINNSRMGRSPLKKSQSLGCVDISLAELVHMERSNVTYPLEPRYLVGDCYKTNYLQVELHWRTS